MTAAGLLAAVVVGAVLVAAGVTKIVDTASWRVQAAGLGAPRAVAPALPWLEVGIGTLLVAGVGTPWPAVAAVILLVSFTVLLVARLRQGERPPCACFGTFSTRPLGWGHVARNVVLVALAALAAVGRS